MDLEAIKFAEIKKYVSVGCAHTQESLSASAGKANAESIFQKYAFQLLHFA